MNFQCMASSARAVQVLLALKQIVPAATMQRIEGQYDQIVAHTMKVLVRLLRWPSVSGSQLAA